MLLQQERAGVKIEVPQAELTAAIERDGKVWAGQTLDLT